MDHLTLKIASADELHLDSGLQREDAHRFYKKSEMVVSGLYFRVDVK